MQFWERFLCFAVVHQASLNPVDLNWGKLFYLCSILLKGRNTQVSKEEMSETGFPKMTQYIIVNSRKACLYF